MQLGINVIQSRCMPRHRQKMEAFSWTELLCSARWHLWETSNDVLSVLLTSCGKFRLQQHYYTFQHCNFWSVWSQCIVLLYECWALHEMTWLLTALAEKHTDYCVQGHGNWTSRPNDARTIWCAFKLQFWGKHNVLPNRSIIFSMLLVGVSHCMFPGWLLMQCPLEEKERLWPSFALRLCPSRLFVLVKWFIRAQLVSGWADPLI